GEREKARDHFERALEIHRKSEEQLPIAGTLRDLGEFYVEGADYQRALPYLDEALDISRTIQDRRGEAAALALMARLERDRGDFAAGHGRANEALSAFESLRRGVASPTLRASFFASAREVQEVEFESLIRLHREHTDEGFDGEALLASERGRA